MAGLPSGAGFSPARLRDLARPHLRPDPFYTVAEYDDGHNLERFFHEIAEQITNKLCACASLKAEPLAKPAALGGPERRIDAVVAPGYEQVDDVGVA